MANTYKNIVITPNRSSNTADPKVVYSGGNTTANTDITLNVYPDSNGTLSWDGSAGQLFSITNDLSNNIFGVNDVSGIPYIEVYANGFVSVAPFGGNVVVGNTAEFILSPGTGLHANGSFGTDGNVLKSNGSSVFWNAPIVNGNAVTLTTQSTIDFTSIPSWVRRISVNFFGVSLSGTDRPLVQVGNSSGIVATGYQSYTSDGATTSTSGFIIGGALAADARYGTLFIINQNGNNWAASGIINSNTTNIFNHAGQIALTGTLTQLRLTRTGTNTFDAGSINIQYE